MQKYQKKLLRNVKIFMIILINAKIFKQLQVKLLLKKLVLSSRLILNLIFKSGKELSSMPTDSSFARHIIRITMEYNLYYYFGIILLLLNNIHAHSKKFRQKFLNKLMQLKLCKSCFTNLFFIKQLSDKGISKPLIPYRQA